MVTESYQRVTAFVLVSVVLTNCSGYSDRVAPVETSGGTSSLTTDQEVRETGIRSDEQITRQDQLVMEAVLFDLLVDEKFFTGMSRGDGSKIVLDAKTGGESFYLRHNQIEGELEKGQVISQELGDELRRRNKVGVSLEDFKPEIPNILVRDLTELPEGTAFAEAFETRFPNAKAYVEAWLPAYSKDGTTALLRFWFGPTPHGAAGTYMLIKVDDQWKVLWRSLAYFA